MKVEVVIPTASPFNMTICPVQNTDGSLIMTVDYGKFNLAVTSIAAAVPDVDLLVEHINTSSGTHYWYS